VRFAFFYNETRRHPVYDYDTAERIAALMRSQPLLAEPRYVTPTQQIACIRRCKAIVSQRYHFGLMGVLAERPVGLFRRGQKLEQLLSEIEAPNLGPHDVIDEERVISGVRELIENGDDVLQRQQAARQRLTRRLIENAGHYLRRPG
jgi:polysaccharide pyruvyl transferase WcaK-like protein